MAAKKQQTTYTLQDALQQMITNYNNTPTWTARTAAERNQIAQDEYKSLYDQYRLNAQQAYDRNDLAYQQQREGIADTYNKQREASAQEYRNAYSQVDRNLLGRGMGRSTYGLQTLSNIGTKAAEAQQAIWEAQGKAEMNVDQQRALAAQQLAQQLQQYGNSEAADARKYARQLEEQDYERGLQGAQYQNQLFGQIYNAIAQQEQNAQDQAWREKQFDYQQQRDTVSDTQWTQQFEQQVKAWENSNNQWERELAEQIRQFDILHPQPGTATGGGGGGYGGSGKKSGGSGTGKTQTPAAAPVDDFMADMDKGTLTDKQKADINATSKVLGDALKGAAANPQQTINTILGYVNKGLDYMKSGTKMTGTSNMKNIAPTTTKKTATTTYGRTDHRGGLI